MSDVIVYTQDGAVRTFECSPEMFQDLRYSVTKLLHEVQRLEVRLQNDGRKKKKQSKEKAGSKGEK